MDIFRKTFILTAVTALAAAILALTYVNTKARIEEYAGKEFMELRKSVMPQAELFKEVEADGQKCYAGYSRASKTGYVIPISVNGYGGKISMVLGIDREGRVTGLNIVSHTETPGLGSKIQDAGFKNQFTGLRRDEVALKKDSNYGRIDSITAATISSRAVMEGVKNAFMKFNILTEQAYKNEMVAAMPDGFYRGTGKGLAGPIEVEIEVKAGKIKAINILKCAEEKQYWTKVKSQVPSMILERQSTDVDVVTGATRTSKGLMDAVQSAIDGGAKREQ